MVVPVTCPVCQAPAIRVHGVCVFCHSPLDRDGDPTELIAYLAERVPGAEPVRGMFGQGRIREVRMVAGGVEYLARLHRETLELQPAAEPAVWVDTLLASLSRDAAGEVERRAALSRAGWAWR